MDQYQLNIPRTYQILLLYPSVVPSMAVISIKDWDYLCLHGCVVFLMKPLRAD